MDAAVPPPPPTPEGGPPRPGDVASCHPVIRDLWAENRHLRSRVAELEAQLAEVQKKLDALLRRSSAARSERAKQARRAKREAADTPATKRHDHGRSPLPEHPPRREVVHDPTNAEKRCPCCGRPRVCIGTKSAEQLDCDPIPFFVRKTTRTTYACRACDPNDVPAEQRIRTAGPATVDPIAKGPCGPGLLALVATGKFADHLPLSRLAGIVTRSGVAVSESTPGDWVRQAADLVEPLRDLMHRRVLWSRAIWHARRKFLDTGASGKPALELIGWLYRTERELPPPDTPEHLDRRKAIRLTRSIPIPDELKTWLGGESKSALPESPSGVALAYVRSHWAACVRYTDEGYLSINNNPSERTLRAIALGRNNWKFVGSSSSGAGAAIHYALVGTCRHLGIDPFAYLREVFPALHALGEKPSDQQLAELLPDVWAHRRRVLNAPTTAA